MRNKKRKTAKAEVKQNVESFKTESNNDIKLYEVDDDGTVKATKNPIPYNQHEILSHEEIEELLAEELDSIDTQNKECNNCCKSENTQLQTLYNEMKEQLNCFDERLKIIDADLKVLNVKDAEKSKILNSIDDLYSHNIKTIEKETNEVLEQLKEKVANINNEITQSTQALKSQDKEQTDLSKRIETIENVLNEAIDLKHENEVLKNEINKLKTDLRDLTQVHSVTREIALENQNKSLWQIIKDRI